MKKIQRRWIYAFLSIVLICICGLIFRKPQTVNAETVNAKRIADIKTGDLLFMGKNAEGYTGLPCRVGRRRGLKNKRNDKIRRIFSVSGYCDNTIFKAGEFVK